MAKRHLSSLVPRIYVGSYFGSSITVTPSTITVVKDIGYIRQDGEDDTSQQGGTLKISWMGLLKIQIRLGHLLSVSLSQMAFGGFPVLVTSLFEDQYGMEKTQIMLPFGIIVFTDHDR